MLVIEHGRFTKIMFAIQGAMGSECKRVELIVINQKKHSEMNYSIMGTKKHRLFREFHKQVRTMIL